MEKMTKEKVKCNNKDGVTTSFLTRGEGEMVFLQNASTSEY
jgi:hypothetical protein